MDINNFQSVFDANVEEEKAFDTMFGAEEDDELMSIVLGEEADEYDLDMNTIDDNETVKDLYKDLEVDKEIEAPKVDSSETVTTPDEVDSEKDTPGEQIACTVAGVADAVEKKEPDEEKIEDEIDKAENKVDLEEEAFINAILGEETEVEIDYDTAPAADDNSDKETEGCCKKEGEGCEDGECEDKEKSEVAPDDEAPVVYDGETTPDENMDDTFSDEGEPEDDDDDDDEDVVDDSCKKENVEEIEDNQSEELTKNDDDEIGLEDKQEDPEVGLESTNLDDIFVEESEAVAADDTTTEKEEDEIIQAAEDDAEMTDAEVEELIGDGDDDDELLDSIMGE